MGIRRKHAIFASVAIAYAVAAVVVTPRLRHSWWYLQENAGRRFPSFCGLAAASCVFPWCAKYGIDACKAMYSRGVESKLDHALFAIATGADPAAAERIDARVMNLSRFKAILSDYRKKHGGYRLWCFGRFDYCLTPPVRTDFGKLLALFSDEAAFSRFASARLYTPAALFSCYVGDEASIDPAFAEYRALGAVLGSITSIRVLFRPQPAGGLAQVRAAGFTPFDVKFPEWIDRGGADAAMMLDFEDSYETAQEARREALIGFDFADRGMATNAIACWAKAARANPRDPILLELADALDFEARSYLAVGNVNGAMQCYENRLEVFPEDVAAIHNFGVCLRKAGKPELAARVFAKAVELDPLQDEHRIELVDCADAGGHPDIAARQIDVLLKRHPGDDFLLRRKAEISLRAHFESVRGKNRPAADASPARYLAD